MGTKRITITMPDELFDVAQQLCAHEHRNQSELFREALRQYAENRLPLEEWQIALARQRLQEYEANPDDVVSWDEIEANARKALAHRDS